MRKVVCASLVALGALTACPAPRAPRAGSTVAARTIPVESTAGSIAGIARGGDTVFVSSSASQPRPSTTVEAVPLGASTARWRANLDGFSGPLVVSGSQVVTAVGGTGSVAGLELRGDPGAAVVALDAATGQIAWRRAVDATEWVSIAALAASTDGALVAGSFSGTLRVGDRVVSSGGRSDGFVARLAATGEVAWLVRVGGPGADGVAAVATAGDRIALAGTFAAGADLLGLPLPPFDDRSSHADGFVAELGATGAPRWARTFGGKADEAVVGVAIDAQGQLAVAASVRDTVHVEGADLVVSGPADGLVAWWSREGQGGTAVLLGGPDFDGLRAITASGDHVVIAGFYSGSVRLGDRTLTADGGDDAFVAELSSAGGIVETWPVSGPGREEVTALAGLPGGFVAGIAHTAAATIGDGSLPSPADPMRGAGIVIRPLH